MKKMIVAVAALAMMAGSAYAADWNFYGNARIQTFWSDTDNTDPTQDDDTRYKQNLETISRIGAFVKVSDELSGRFEYGAASSVNLRLLYGEWNFGAGKLLVGQDWVPMNLTGSNQVYLDDRGLQRYGGEMCGLRAAQLKLTFAGFQIAFVKNDTNYYSTTTGTTVDTDADVVIPMIQIKYTLDGANWALNFVGGWQTFDVDTANDDITSWGLGLDFAAKFGAFNMSAQVNGGENVGNLWMIDVDNGATNGLGKGYAEVAGNDVIDNEALGARIVLAYTFNDMFKVEVGYGYQQTELDVRGADEDESQSYYISFPITMAAGVLVVPEIGVVDFMDRGQDDITYFGAKWQINF